MDPWTDTDSSLGSFPISSEDRADFEAEMARIEAAGGDWYLVTRPRELGLVEGGWDEPTLTARL